MSSIEKRISINTENLKKVRLIMTLEDDMYGDLTEKEGINIIINKAIESYFNSDEIQEKFKNLIK